ncbi:P-loop containing nucleoside triphosphate hydrolase protein, partial [Hyaloscypha finlandica]
MDPKYQWRADRISHQQAIKYKNLLDIRVKHSEALHWDSLDLRQGKGTGRIILLHSLTGSGKTALAQAAQAYGNLLFKASIGDLGMIPERLEISLRENLHLARIWDYILLLDEADTFFTQRSQADMATNKNALVSVFLRVLDSYNSILFLTTNRAHVLDEVFKSCTHYKIYYPDLTPEQTLDIWKLNTSRVPGIEEQSES